MRLPSLLLLIFLVFSCQAFAENLYIVRVDKNIDTLSLNGLSSKPKPPVCFDEYCYIYVYSEEDLDLLIDNDAVIDYEENPDWKFHGQLLQEVDYINQYMYTDPYFNWNSGVSDMSLVTGPLPYVVIMDTGYISHTNPPRMDTNTPVTCYDVYNNMQQSCRIVGTHGQHVAGIVSSRVAGNFTGSSYGKVNVIVMNIADNSGELDVPSIARAVDKIIDLKVNSGINIVAVNMSFGGPFYIDSMYHAINALKNNDIIAVTSAGNDATDNSIMPNYPADYSLPNIISVGSVSKDLGYSSYTNFGPTVDIAAPGDIILSNTPFYTGKDVSYDIVPGANTNTNKVNLNTTQSIGYTWNPSSVTGWTISGNELIMNSFESNNYILLNLPPDNTSLGAYNGVSFDITCTSLAVLRITNMSTGDYYDTACIALLADKPENTHGYKYKSSNPISFAIEVKILVGNVSIKRVFSSAYNAADSYSYMSGTSMSAPVITGILGAGKAFHPGATSPQLIHMLYSSASKRDDLADKFIDGRVVNFGNFIQALKTCKTNVNTCGSSTEYPSRGVVSAESNTNSDSSPHSVKFSSSGGCSMSTGKNGIDFFIFILPIFFILLKRYKYKANKNL